MQSCCFHYNSSNMTTTSSMLCFQQMKRKFNLLSPCKQDQSLYLTVSVTQQTAYNLINFSRNHAENTYNAGPLTNNQCQVTWSNYAHHDHISHKESNILDVRKLRITKLNAGREQRETSLNREPYCNNYPSHKVTLLSRKYTKAIILQVQLHSSNAVKVFLLLSEISAFTSADRNSAGINIFKCRMQKRSVAPHSALIFSLLFQYLKGK